MSLTPAPQAPAAALPVQRAHVLPAERPAPPPVAAPAPARQAPAPAVQRVTAPPRSTSVAVQRSGGGNSKEKPAPSVTSQVNPRELREDQVAELVNRLIGPVTRLLRTELRLDRERIGRLRDPRH
ncbi:hypothetical protein ABZ172_28910 [Streptomyces sp. NPDC006296]|uniref:hypothetical protein n=1 Tax=Streptomyces sp. NPDC006296 TaxID=3156746 RepID=UPI0033B6715C